MTELIRKTEIKHGTWISHSGLPLNDFCSVCAKDSPHNKHWDYCPTCGADMRGAQMKNIMCLFGNHVYSDASAEVNAVDEKDGYLICRVRNCCLRCGKPYEDIVRILIPKWLCKKRDGE